MTQNIYDDPDFFAAYGDLPRSQAGLDGAPEWPALRALLPPLGGRTVVDLGCGYGWFCRWARTQGAARVTGLDVSRRMLARARQETHDAAILYVRADLEMPGLRERSTDLVYSSLALHYVADLGSHIGAVYQALDAGGHFVFSVEHPVFTAPTEPGWAVDAKGRKTWPVDGYSIEGRRRTMWLGKPVVKWHRTVAGYVNVLLRAGLTIIAIDEWRPTDEQIAARPALADERQRPPFLIVAARK